MRFHPLYIYLLYRYEVQAPHHHQVKLLKARRRTLKNRGYAASCREKRQTRRQLLTVQRDQLRAHVVQLRFTNAQVRAEIERARLEVQALEQAAAGEQRTAAR